MEAIRSLYRDYALAWETNDADLWLSIWDEGGTQMPPRHPCAQQRRTAQNHAAAICAEPGNVLRYRTGRT